MSQLKKLSLFTNPKLDRLLKEAAGRNMTPAERREHQISFVYGQMMNCAPNLTKDDVR